VSASGLEGEAPISEQNVEVVRAGYAAFSRGDVARAMRLIDERITIAGQITPDGQPAQGREGLLSNVARVAEAFEELSYEPVELIDLGERVLAHIRVSGTGREGISSELEFGQLWTIEGGRAVRVENYTYWEDALAAAGMPK
jgi:ketosteroid isomerase-like protein